MKQPDEHAPGDVTTPQSSGKVVHINRSSWMHQDSKVVEITVTPLDFGLVVTTSNGRVKRVIFGLRLLCVVDRNRGTLISCAIEDPAGGTGREAPHGG